MTIFKPFSQKDSLKKIEKDRKSVKEVTPACVDKLLRSSEVEEKLKKIMNAVKRSTLAEHLVNNQNCAKF